MWKDFFYFSKGQRTAIIILISTIIVVIAVSALMSRFFPTNKHPFNDSITIIVQDFKRNLLSSDSLRKAQRQAEYESKYKQYKNESYPYESEIYTLFKFDPNTADSSTLAKLGLRSYTITNILKYRSKGGKFKTSESFAKTYGISKEKYEELEPYIRIAQSYDEQIDTNTVKNKSTLKAEKILVELNSADTSLLMQVKGIGVFYAKGIIRLRNELGGFVKVDQVREVYGMKEENFEAIREFLVINSQLIRKININTASVDRLKSHPYLSFYQAKAIYELRRKKGKLANTDELKNLEELDENTIEKIKPYLDFQ
jgi:DNA uptake protein ComE-like DNA-binding protein